MANRKKVFVPSIVEGMAALGCTLKEIATVYSCSESTIKKHLREDHELKEAYEKGKARETIELRKAQRKAALSGNATMLIWLGKQKLGQTDQTFVKVNLNRCKTTEEKRQKILSEMSKGNISLEAGEKLINTLKTIDNEDFEELKMLVHKLESKIDGEKEK